MTGHAKKPDCTEVNSAMVDEKVEDWIQRTIDGEIDPQESERLRDTLARDPNARDLFDRMERLADQLGEVEIVDPPDDLKARIMQTLPELRAEELAAAGHEKALNPGREQAVNDAERRAATSAARRSPAPRRSAPQAGIRRRDIYTFLCGAAMAAAVVAAMLAGDRAPGLDPAALTGTMRPDVPGGVWRLVDRESIAGPGYSGAAAIHTAPGWTQVVLDLDADRALAVTLEFEGTDLSPMSFAQTELGPGVFDAQTDRVHFQHAGSSTYRIMLRSRAGKEDITPLNLTLDSSETTLRMTLHTAPVDGP